MKFSKQERELIKVIVECENQGGNIAFALNYSRLLEKYGVAIVTTNSEGLVFLQKDKYPDFYPFNTNAPYVPILLNLIEILIKNGSIKCGEDATMNPLVIGAIHSEWVKPGVIAVNGNEQIILEGPGCGWFVADGDEKYWIENKWRNQLLKIERYLYSDYCVSEKLKELVENAFKTDEEIRFAKQQRITWISIIVAALLGILGIIF